LPSGAVPSVPLAIAKGRFRRSFLGYRPRDVDDVIASRDAALEAVGEKLAEAQSRIGAQGVELTERAEELQRQSEGIAEMERVAARLAERVILRERELRGVRQELARVRADGEESIRSLARLATQLDDVRRQASGQATRIRLRALRDAAELSERLAELAKQPGGAGERLMDSLQEAIRRISGDEDGAEERAGTNGHDAVLEIPQEVNGHREREPGRLFAGLVELDIGPLSDFSQLVGFEDAANGIDATSEISVKRFTEGRATLAMRLKHPVELLRELEERAPFEFVVRDTRKGRVVLDVDGD